MNQTITINIFDAASAGSPSTPDNFLNGALPKLGAGLLNFVSSNTLRIALILVFIILISVLFLMATAHTRRARRPVFMLCPLLILAPLVYLTLAPNNTASAAASLQLNGTNLSLNITKDVNPNVSATGTSTSTATVSTTNVTGYKLSATMDANSLQTLQSNRIDLTLTGGDVSNLVFSAANRGELLFSSNTPATNVSTSFNLAVTVPSTIAAGAYVVDINFSAKDNSPVLPLTMQDPALASFCANNMSIYPDTSNGPNELSLSDIRVDAGGVAKSYHVRKLATVWDAASGAPDTTTGGKCWMVDNLALGSYTVTAADSNVTNPFTIAGNVNNAASHSRGRCDGAYNTANGNGYHTCSGTNYPRNEDANSLFSAYADFTSVNSTYGYHYNFWTVTAGTRKGSSRIDATESICAKGWRLPSGGPGSEFEALDRAYGGTGTTQTGTPAQLSTLWLQTGAFSGVFSGYYNGSHSQRGNEGYWWSGTPNQAAGGNLYQVRITPSTVQPDYSYMYIIANAVRCVLI